MKECQKGCGQLVIAGCDPAEHFELIEKAFNQMPLFVDVEITGPRFNAVFPGWDGVPGFLRCDVVPDFLRAISLITENVASRNLQFRKKINSRICIMHLTAG